jgi:phosphatidylglycerophosphate synthase
MPLFPAIASAYQRTRKPKDIFWNRFVARPAAAVLLVPLERSPVTPNQVTLASLVVFALGAALLVTAGGHAGLWLAVVVIELSYVLDCVDGQLARLRGTSTPVGAHLDFLMDELKAFLLVAATGVRLWRADADGDPRWLLEALCGLVAVASAISLTTFVRRPEYLTATGKPPPASAGDYGAGFSAPPAPAGLSPLRLVEMLGRFLVHYPSYLVYVALLDRLDVFLHVYTAINAAHAARSLLGVTRALGRRPRP